jgi:hypothetical protein
MRRIFIDFITLCCLVGIGIGLYRLSSSKVPLSLLAQVENIIWVTIVIAVAICRAWLERIFGLSTGGWIRTIAWAIVVLVAHLILFWLDTVVNPHDTFMTVLAFGLLIFLLPSVIFSAIAYWLMSMFLGKVSRRSRYWA